MTTPIEEKLENSNLWQKVSIALKEISKDPMSMRGILKGAVTIINAIALAILLSPPVQAFKSGLGFADKTIRILQIGSTIEKWSFYKISDPLTLIRDVADTILTAAAIPQFLDYVKAISFTKISHAISQVPVIGFLGIIPIIPILNVTEIFVNVFDALVQGRDLHHIISGKYLADCEKKVKKWKQAAVDLKEGVNPILLLTDKQHKKLEKIQIESQLHPEKVKALTFDEITVTVNTDQFKRLQKWENKIAKIDQRKNSKIMAIAFHVTLIALMTILTVGAFIASPVIPVALAIVGLSLFTIGLTRFIYGAFHPPVDSIRFEPIRLA